MQVNNKLYKNIGIHVIVTLFTVEKGNLKVLLVKRSNNPFNGYWALPSGALYNNELLKEGAKRELKEKTGLENIEFEMCGVFDKINRSNIQRMIGISFIGVIDREKVSVLKSTLKTSNIEYFSIDNIPNLAYDHNEIIMHSLNVLKEKITKTSILQNLLPKYFTLPELLKVYETILNEKLDRRNFRKKLLNENIVIYANKYENFEGKKPAKMYSFNNKNAS